MNDKNNFKFWVLLTSYSWLIVLVLFPFLIILGISLSEPEFGRLPYKFFIFFENNKLQILPSFDNFIELFNEPMYYSSLLTSLRLAIIATLFCLIMGYPIAYSIFLLPKQYKALLILMIMVPFWTSLLIRVYSWIVLLRNNGLINNLLIYLGLINEPIEFLNSESSVIIGMVYTYLPFMILPIYASLEKINFSLLEAAQNLGCKPLRVFWSITFPLSLSGVLAGCFMVFIPALGEYVIPDLLGGTNIITIGKILWSEFFINRDWVASSALTILLSMIIVIPFVFMNKFLNRREI